MKCPHCAVEIHRQVVHVPLFEFSEESDVTEDLGFEVDHQECPACMKQIIFLQKGMAQFAYRAGESEYDGINENDTFEEWLIWPKGITRFCPPEVPEHLRSDFIEASEVLPISPKASAALSRRCMQQLLKDVAGVTSSDLSRQIDEVMQSNTLSSDLAEQLDAVRNIGNFAAHTQKSTHSGEILDVEPHEADWNLDVLQELFDHYFVKPERASARRTLLNQKLAAAGKPPLR